MVIFAFQNVLNNWNHWLFDSEIFKEPKPVVFLNFKELPNTWKPSCPHIYYNYLGHLALLFYKAMLNMTTLLEIAISWCKKWVINNYQNMNYMQLMRRCNKCSQGALVFSFVFRRGRGLGKGFFIFSLCSQYVSTLFPSSSQYVPTISMCFPTCSQ